MVLLIGSKKPDLRVWAAVVFVGLFLGACSGDDALGPRDTTSPQVQILSPASGSRHEFPVTIEAQADDEVGVERVSLRLNDTLITSKSEPPYSFTLTEDMTELNGGSVVIEAYDAAGNVNQAEIAILFIRPDVGQSDISIQFEGLEGGNHNLPIPVRITVEPPQPGGTVSLQIFEGSQQNGGEAPVWRDTSLNANEDGSVFSTIVSDPECTLLSSGSYQFVATGTFTEGRVQAQLGLQITCDIGAAL